MDVFRNILLWGSENAWLRDRVPNVGFVKKAVKRFMPGEEVEDALRAAGELKKSNINSVFTRLGENISDLSEAEQVAHHYVEVYKKIEESGLSTEISVKLTQLGLDLSFEEALKNFQTIAAKAQKQGNVLWIDIESSSYVDKTIEFYKRAKEKYEKIGLCLQAYLYRTQDDLTDLLSLSPSIRLVKGAYKEDASIAFPKKSDVDKNYFELSKQLLHASLKDNKIRAAFATHDIDLIGEIKSFAGSIDFEVDKLEFQMLYGIIPDEQKRLAQEGHTIIVLVSYGNAWYPWYMRRLAERPANVGFVLKNIISR